MHIRRLNFPFVVSDLFSFILCQFLEMSSLQAALPTDQLSSNFLGGVSQSWFPPNSVAPYIPSPGQGRLFPYNVRAANLNIQWEFDVLIKLFLIERITKYFYILMVLFSSFLVSIWCRWGSISGSASAKLSITVRYFLPSYYCGHLISSCLWLS